MPEGHGIRRKGMEEALRSNDAPDFGKFRNLCQNLRGMKLEGVGYAGARELTSSSMNVKDSYVQDVIGFG
jgi:hypothetical protein